MEYIYGDVLFVINFCMDFLSLYISGKLMHMKITENNIASTFLLFISNKHPPSFSFTECPERIFRITQSVYFCGISVMPISFSCRLSVLTNARSFRLPMSFSHPHQKR